jgi:multidrug efflux pump subunit AcrA (membrane-fusion protein)
VVASGVIAPAQEARLVFSLGGRLQALDIVVGDQVVAGQILAQMEGEEELQAAVSKAEFELLQAQQELEDLKKAAESARVEAMKEIITFERELRDAQYTLDNFTTPSTQANMDTVEALQKMKERLDTARSAFEPYKYRPSTDQTREDYKELLDEAQADYNAAVKRLQYEYDLEVAEAELAEAQRDYAMLKEGPDPDKMKLAEARIANTQTQLRSAQAAVERLKLSAPFAGTVSQVNSHSGEWVTAGQTVLTLADLEHLQVETTDLSERDIPRIQTGQTATVFVEALGVSVTGRVAEIAPLADVLGGDVVYRTTIEIESYPEGLRAGMSVEVRFE